MASGVRICKPEAYTVPALAEVEVDIETGHIRPIKMVQVQDGASRSTA